LDLNAVLKSYGLTYNHKRISGTPQVASSGSESKGDSVGPKRRLRKQPQADALAKKTKAATTKAAKKALCVGPDEGEKENEDPVNNGKIKKNDKPAILKLSK
jgi:hypothetical protein